MISHAVIIAGAGPTGLVLAGELALAGVDVAIVERRATQELAGSRAGGLHARTIEVFDQRGIAERFLAEGTRAQVAGFAWHPLDLAGFPTRHPYGLALWQNHIERILAGWVAERGVPIYREREVTGFAQDEGGVEVAGMRARYLVGCDGGRSAIRKAAGIAFSGTDATTSCILAEAQLADEPPWGMRHDATGIHGFSKIAARVLRNTRAQAALRTVTSGTTALREVIGDLLRMAEPRRRFAAMMSGLDVQYFEGGHPLVGRRMPDRDLLIDGAPRRMFELLHAAEPVLLDLGADLEPPPRIRTVRATCALAGPWELPATDAVPPPAAVLVRPDGHVAWVGDRADSPLADALATWFGAR